MSLAGQESVCRNCSGALVQEVKKVLTGGDRPTHQARANFMIKIGDVLEGRLLSMEKAKPFDLPMAIHIQHLERTLASSSRVLAKVCVIDSKAGTWTIWQASGVCCVDGDREVLDLNSIEKVECSTSVAPFQFSGKFDLRCKKATLTGQNVSYMHHTQGKWFSKPAPEHSLYLTLKSSECQRDAAAASPAEANMIVKLMEVEKDMVSASSLAEELDVGLQPFQSLDIVRSWLQRLQLSNKSELPQAMLTGPTGSGKSYLLNAVLGHIGLVPSDCSTGRAVSAANVRCSYRPWVPSLQDGPGEWLLSSHSADESCSLNVLGHKRFGVEIDLVTLDEWKQECAEYVSQLAHYWLEERFEQCLLKKRPQDAESGAQLAWDKLVAVYSHDSLTSGRKRNWSSADELTNHLNKLDKASVVVKKLGKSVTREENDATKFSDFIKQYVRSDTPAEGREMRYWPVVKDVHLMGPFERLRGFKHLMDCVGCGDSNRARDVLAKKREKESDVVFVVSDIARCVSNAVTVDLLKNQLRSTLLRVSQSDLAFVCTKAEVINEREAKDTLSLGVDATMKECIVSRNDQVRKNLKKEMRQMLRDMQRGDADDDFSWLSCRVFCVATKAYMTLKGVETSHSAVDDLTLSDTEVPHLVQEIQAWLVQALRSKSSKRVMMLEAAAIRSHLHGESLEEHKELCKAAFEEQISAFKAELGRRLDQFARKVAQIFDEGLLSSIKEGSRVAMRGSVNTASAWHGFHPSAYNAAARKGGINPNSRRGPIHWPKELSRPCYDSFQPKWMELFGNQLPKLYDEWQQIVEEEASAFHDRMAKQLPQIGSLQEIRDGSDIAAYLQRVRDDKDDEEAFLKRDLCDEVTQNVIGSMKGPFEECKQIKGKGSFALMKDHIDRSVKRIQWEAITEGLVQGCKEFYLSFGEMREDALEQVPKRLHEGYRPLWQSLDQQALAQWNRLKEAMLPAVDRIKADVKALKERVEQREACCSSSVKDGEDSLQAIEDMEDIEDIEDIDMEEEHESGSNEGAESDQGAESWHSDIGSEPEEDMPTASPKVAEVADLKSEDPVSPEEAPSDTETKGLKRKREDTESLRVAEKDTPTPCYAVSLTQ